MTLSLAYTVIIKILIVFCFCFLKFNSLFFCCRPAPSAPVLQPAGGSPRALTHLLLLLPPPQVPPPRPHRGPGHLLGLCHPGLPGGRWGSSRSQPFAQSVRRRLLCTAVNVPTATANVAAGTAAPNRRRRNGGGDVGQRWWHTADGRVAGPTTTRGSSHGRRLRRSDGRIAAFRAPLNT